MRNPIRRSKKTGLTQGGRVMCGKPKEKWSRIFAPTTWDKLSEQSGERRIIRENPSKNYLHPASPTQIEEVLHRLPEELTVDVKAVILRRLPKFDKKHGIEAWKRYFCIVLNAFPKNLRMTWRKPPTQATRKHMEPWCTRWTEAGGKLILQWTLPEIKRYYLYHLLLHEVGHFHGWFGAKKRREDYAENFAFEWARNLGEL